MAKPQAAVSLHLTSTGLRGFAAPPGVETVWDIQLPGFGLRTRGKATEAGWSWVFKYRHRAEGKPKRITLGRFRALTPDEARKAAKRYGEAARVPGADLWDKDREERETRQAANEEAKRAAASDAAMPTVAYLWDRYLVAEGQHKKAAHSYKQLWRSHLQPFFGATKVADLTREMVEDFTASRAATPGAANRALALLSVMLSRAVSYGWRKGCSPENPAKGVARNPEHKVDFHFTAEEFGRILMAAETYAERTVVRETVTRGSPPVNDRSEAPGLAILLLAGTGARAGEVLGAHEDQFSVLPDNRLLWGVESTNTKSGKPVTRVLSSDLSKRLLAWMPKARAIREAATVVALGTPRWLFPQLDNPERHINRLEKAWNDILDAAGLKGARRGRIHDLRHSVATHMRRRGKSLSDIQQQLGHASLHTTTRYAHHMPEGVIENGDLVGDIGRDAIAAAKAQASATVTALH